MTKVALKTFFSSIILLLVSFLGLTAGILSACRLQAGHFNFLEPNRPNPLYTCNFCNNQNQEVLSLKDFFSSAKSVLYSKNKQIIYLNKIKSRVLGLAQVLKTPSTLAEASLDKDLDGLTDRMEEYLGTDPSNADTDQDGYLDGVEVRNGYNPLE